MKKIILSLLVLIVFNCKDKKEEPKKVKQEVNYDFIVTASIKTDQADTFQFVLKDIDNETTIDKTVIQVSENFKEVQGKVKARYDFEYPTVLYLGLGYVKPKKVIIEHFKISYKGKEHVFTPKDFKEYFTVNRFVEFGEQEGELITKKIDNQHVPILGLSRKGIDLIK
ncbi:hypothetical protein FHS04_000675 [Mesoflavibacter sabulilitoris]|uniref:Uncharacterized protein n=1 Tax=Mesoflavibacter zeaxanthinifaciens subsp. sabulilitoris TaxID=1520893 RepID=A0A2T1N6J4_9FLAO|nr:hypothetical protein [Mesoflavibacter zeaxanthinifaciens]MBB3123178.1 hypothetical protein [Mesoflavibacter zeaxanthinifaciens subsp. sabulilitoris]PSG87183.1 hypothetical protein C7H61_13835 [Mesoflavibacter zeaxanthinifaciens subsp. sabulilitoris]